MRSIMYIIAAASLAACSTNPAASTAQDPAPAQLVNAPQSADVTELSHLTSILIDASSLYDAAAEDSSNEAYASQLRSLANSRRSMTDVFQARVAQLGGEPAEMGQAIGTAHRVFMEARTLGNEDTKVAVQEALRGENYLVAQIQEALENTALSAETRAFLNAQAPRITADRDRLTVYANSLG